MVLFPKRSYPLFYQQTRLLLERILSVRLDSKIRFIPFFGLPEHDKTQDAAENDHHQGQDRRQKTIAASVSNLLLLYQFPDGRRNAVSSGSGVRDHRAVTSTLSNRKITPPVHHQGFC